MKVLAISDIHGRTSCLKKLLTDAKIDTVDKIVFGGDYVGYGDDSLGAIRFVSDVAKRFPEKTVVLFGNWEMMLYVALTREDGAVVSYSEAIKIMMKRHNFEKSIKPFLHDKNAADEFLHFFKTLKRYYLTPDKKYLFVHGGISTDKDPEKAMAQSGEYIVLWPTEEDLVNEEVDAQPYHVVGGHIPFCFFHDKEYPYSSGNYMNIDFRASSNYGRLGYIIVDTSTNKKTYNAVPVNQWKYNNRQNNKYQNGIRPFNESFDDLRRVLADYGKLR